MELEALGMIKRMVLPEGWKEESNRDESESQTFRHPQEQDVKISFYYRGKPLSSRSAQRLEKVLAAPSHTLSDSECESIEVIMRDASEPEFFRRKTVRTEVLNGIKVLVLEGFWILSDLDCTCIFVASEENGTRIDEIYFLAPPDKFATYQPEFYQSLASIQWECSIIQ